MYYCFIYYYKIILEDSLKLTYFNYVTTFIVKESSECVSFLFLFFIELSLYGNATI